MLEIDEIVYVGGYVFCSTNILGAFSHQLPFHIGEHSRFPKHTFLDHVIQFLVREIQVENLMVHYLDSLLNIPERNLPLLATILKKDLKEFKHQCDFLLVITIGDQDRS